MPLMDASLGAKFLRGTPFATYTTTQTTSDLDTQGYRFAVVLLECGTFTGDETLDLKVQAATTSGGSYSDVTGAAFTQISTSNDAAVYFGVLRLDGAARYLQLVGTQAGTGNALYSAHILLTHAATSELVAAADDADWVV